jgi:hypothetical protein
VPAEPIDKRLFHRISTGHGTFGDALTNDVEYFNISVFPERKGVTIGQLPKGKHAKFFQINDTPAPSYLPETFNPPRRKAKVISCQKRRKREKYPGPCTYNPGMNDLPKAPAFSLFGQPERDDWLTKQPAITSPAPGEYDPQPPKRSFVGWSIGEKSRRGKSRKQSKNGPVFAVGTFLVKLGEDISLNDARSYVSDHPEFRVVVEEILQLVYRDYPDDPLQAIRDEYRRVLEEGEKKVKKRETEKEPGFVLFHFRDPRDILWVNNNK